MSDKMEEKFKSSHALIMGRRGPISISSATCFQMLLVISVPLVKTGFFSAVYFLDHDRIEQVVAPK